MISLVVGLLGGCKHDSLNVLPKDKIDAAAFFNTATDLEVYTNRFYDQLSTTTVYTDDASSDNIVTLIASARVKGARVVPTARGTGGWNWSDLRSINYFLNNYEKCPDVAAKAKYGGIARFFRAYFYFEKVRAFGDVPLYKKVLEAGDPELYKDRDSRKVVIDAVLEDINFAIANIPKEVKLNSITKYTALALKARICLFEGTFRKYHGLGDYQDLLTEAAAAAEELMSYNVYRIFTTGGPTVAYRELFARLNQDVTETILARDYEPNFPKHNINSLMTSATSGAYGIPKDMINSYLMKDGTRFTDVPGYATKEFYQEMQNRDPRLTQTTAGPDFAAYGSTTREPVNLNITTTGYRVIKALSSKDQWSASYFDLILFRYAEILLIFAEAKAELGTLTDQDWSKTIGVLRARAGITGGLNNKPVKVDPYFQSRFFPGISNPEILEIRRERGTELSFEGFSWPDICRWKVGELVTKDWDGIYIPQLDVAYDMNGDGKKDVSFTKNLKPDKLPGVYYLYVGEKLANGAINNAQIDPVTHELVFMKDQIRTWNDKLYFYPIPAGDLVMNPNLGQNPGW